ncbi:hypothetical protein JZU46_01095 [bacterium]|jgi:hypothetical protein|nr:hypothetical protein [bacterium]
MSELTLWIIILVSIGLLFFITDKIRQFFKVRKWRKRLSRRDYVKFFYGSSWHVGRIRKFKDNGSTLIVREITADFTQQPFQFSIPLKIAVPTYKL